MATSRLEKLHKVIQEANDGLATHAQVKELMGVLTKFVKEAKADLEQKTATNKNEIGKKLDKALSKLDETAKQIDAKVAETDKIFRSELRTITRLIEQRVDDLERDIRKDLVDEYNDSELWAELKTIRTLIPKEKDDDTELVERIEYLEGELDEKYKALDKKIVMSKGGGVRRVFQPYLDDFSDDTDGANKTFYLSREPLRTNNIEVHCTDFPIILRPSTDFTVAGKALTLTSAVDAPTSGATLLIKYYA